MESLMKIVKSLEDFGFLIKDVARTIKNETKDKKNGFLGMLLYTLGANIFHFFIQ